MQNVQNDIYFNLTVMMYVFSSKAYPGRFGLFEIKEITIFDGSSFYFIR